MPTCKICGLTNTEIKRATQLGALVSRIRDELGCHNHIYKEAGWRRFGVGRDMRGCGFAVISLHRH